MIIDPTYPADAAAINSAPKSVRKHLALLPALFLASPISAIAEDWAWSVTPYAWLIGTEFSTKVDIPEDGEQTFSDIGKNLDFAAQLHVEAERDGLGFMIDFTNLQLSDSSTQEGYELKTDSSTTLVEAAVMIRAHEGNRSSTTLLAGVRILDVDLELTVAPLDSDAAPTDLATDDSLADFMVGVRYQYDINEQWTLLARGDVASGDTDFSWNASLVAARDVGRSGRFILGYRYLDVEFKRADAFLDPKLVVSGPMLGYSFAF